MSEDWRDYDWANDSAIKTKPLTHQLRDYLRFRDAEYLALFHEQGLGKTKTLLDVAAHAFLNNRIDALVVLAPRSVRSNWPLFEIPEHLAVPHVAHDYRENTSDLEMLTRRKLLLVPEYTAGRLRILCVAYSTLRTPRGLEYLRRFVLIYRTMIVADESTALKNGRTETARAAKELSDRCHRRAIATGTPVAQSPLDAHSQVEFLDRNYWPQRGLRSHGAFRNEFSEMKLQRLASGKAFNKVMGPRNLDKLNRLLAPFSSRLLKEDSDVQLPPKVYQLRTHELSARQRKMYDGLVAEYVAQYDADPGGFVEAALAIVRITRLQQICSGFVTVESIVDVDEADVDGDGEEQEGRSGSGDGVRGMRRLEVADGPLFGEPRAIVTERHVRDVVEPEDNPRLKLLEETVEEIAPRGKFIVWCKFRRDVQLVCQTLGERMADDGEGGGAGGAGGVGGEGRGRAVRYEGATSTSDRERALTFFRDPGSGVDALVVNVASLSMGVTLTIAKTSIYFSHHSSLEKRLQSEDRNHRIGQSVSPLIVDFAAEDTIEERIIRALRQKFDISSQVMGDRFREWICGV
jgi:SNF2 family DNA or RNA helicase